MTAPLDGILVLDLTRNLAGPFCTMVLGDLGARVIKIERPGVGDDTRDWRPPSWGERSSLFPGVNRSKESMGNEGKDLRTALGASLYGEGPFAYLKVLEAWRQQGGMAEDLELVRAS